MNNNIIKIGEGKFIKLTALNKSSFEQLEILPEKIEITSGTKKLAGGKSTTLKYKITPEDVTNKGVEWTSSDPSVVTVDSNGKVTAKRTGKATITVKTNSGNKIASREITVSNEYVVKKEKYKMVIEKSRYETLVEKIDGKINLEAYLIETKITKPTGIVNYCKYLALYYTDMIYYDEVLNKSVVTCSDVKADRINDYSKRVKVYSYKEIKEAIDRGEVVFLDYVVETESGEMPYRMVCIGYKGKGESIEDFLLISPVDIDNSNIGRIGKDSEDFLDDRFVVVPRVRK